MNLENTNRSLDEWEKIFQTEIEGMTVDFDPSHDSLHLKRVVTMAKRLCEKEKANPHIVIPGAWLHDFVVIPKDNPLRKQASRISATRAVEFLERVGYPKEYHSAIAHCIEAHSFSANISTETLEAKVVQDADRLDALGAVGIARMLITAGRMKRPLYSEVDPLCEHGRTADDGEFTIDHFYIKLFKVAETLKTKSALAEGQRRAQVMRVYLKDLGQELI